ncbi:hypothetical protein [Papillibacter cinnamivorans]|uniref:Uncharacterized protein n=1 Tax=Papillibacter cinnamivorans DSM 12816 TaxID=1122930 RepID=A0A1W1YIA7_9FIRM|nr:hypothetical protein [Papillibacter cinnamivorans]SMC35488.1 hypothetical protein SAMN02745168_0408 [Papillibacter cinnamivorans DSM 12816]
MSVRGIDMQIAAQRTSDVAKVAANQKSGERMQDYLTLQRNEEERLRETSVTQTEGAEKAVISRDGGGSERQQSEENKREAESGPDEGDEEQLLDIPPSSRIDIRI